MSEETERPITVQGPTDWTITTVFKAHEGLEIVHVLLTRPERPTDRPASGFPDGDYALDANGLLTCRPSRPFGEILQEEGDRQDRLLGEVGAAFKAHIEPILDRYLGPSPPSPFARKDVPDGQ